MTDPSAPVDLAGKKILLTSMYYAPETTGSAPYTTDLAEHLAALGAQVRVVTTHAHYPQWRRDVGTSNRWLREERAEVEVLRVPVYVPRRPTLARRAAYESTFTVTALRAAMSFAPDVVLACTPALFAARLGAAVAQRRGVPYVAVVQDLITSAAEQSGMGGAGRAKALLRAIEQQTFARAHHVCVPSPAFVPVVQSLAPGVPVTVVPNWTRVTQGTSDRQAVRRSLGWSDRFVVAHTGNMGLKQGLEELAPTLRHMSTHAPDVLFSFIGCGSQRDALLAATEGMANVEVRGPVPDEEYLGVLKAANVLLVNERSTVRDMSLPSKLTSYFAAEQPVLAVTRADSATATEIVRSGAGVLVPPAEPAAFERLLRELRAVPHTMTALGRAGVRHSEARLNPHQSLATLTAVVSDVLAKPTSHTTTPFGERTT